MTEQPTQRQIETFRPAHPSHMFGLHWTCQACRVSLLSTNRRFECGCIPEPLWEPGYKLARH